MQIPESEWSAHISKYKNILYLGHRNADPDAIGSGFALQQAFGGSLGAVEGASKAGRALASAIGAELILDPPFDNFDLVVVVDASVRLQLRHVQLSRYAVVDHHLDRGMLEGAEFYIQRPANSTSEIVWKILKHARSVISPQMALGLMAGIISDTGRFRRASVESFTAAAELLHAGGIDYEDALDVLSIPVDLSQRIATLRAASRTDLERIDDWLIATTDINSFEGSSAMALVELGADIAFAAGKHEGLSRVSGRASREAVRAGINLARILAEVALDHGGEGGGHMAAAAMEAPGEAKILLAACKEKAAESLKNLGLAML
jgi:nanoRNase/pAp phosphatase (c-di-AMP/oligoRNAs hydrolase)